MYQIEFSTNRTTVCVKKDLSEPFHPFIIPPNATLLSSLTIGTNAFFGGGLDVNVFTGEIEGGKMRVKKLY